VSCIEEELFLSISTHLHPEPYRFSPSDAEVFRDELRLVYIMNCKPLDNIDFHEFEQRPLEIVRRQLGIDIGLLRACYAL
jgi:hypothetical protein